jgi:hypothetical protein
VEQARTPLGEPGPDQREGTTATAVEGSKEVARTAGDRAQQVAGTVREQAGDVRQAVKHEGRNLVREASDQVRRQARAQTGELAGALRRVADQANALSEGRREETGALGDYARQAASTLQQWASTADEKGFEGLVEDVQRFARRRPGVFLLGAAAAGFAVGRLVRSASGGSGESQAGRSDMATALPSPGDPMFAPEAAPLPSGPAAGMEAEISGARAAGVAPGVSR